MHRFLVGLTCLVCVLAAACSSSNKETSDAGGADDGSTDAGCVPYESDADLTTPTVSFSNDIVPIMNFSCGIAGSTCHGATNVTLQQRPFLGFFDGGTDASAVVTGIVGVDSQEAPSVKLVAADNPGESFLMHKMDGDECVFMVQCQATTTQYPNCGASMPYSSNLLDPATRDTVRRWIAQGAQNN
jgi:hypothetical protein